MLLIPCVLPQICIGGLPVKFEKSPSYGKAIVHSRLSPALHFRYMFMMMSIIKQAKIFLFFSPCKKSGPSVTRNYFFLPLLLRLFVSLLVESLNLKIPPNIHHYQDADTK